MEFSDPFTHENHVAFIQKRRRMEKERTEGNIIKFDEDPGHRALRHMIQLKNKYNDDMDKVQKAMGTEQYNNAENEIIARSGDPNRFNEETGGWIIWP